MGVGDQFACVSLVALFSIALVITSSLFVEHRAAKNFARPVAWQTRAPL